MIKIIDVTLRDGGYRTNFHFAENVVEQVILNLSYANIDYIEVGYRNGSFKPIHNIGDTGISTNEYLKLVKKACPNSALGVIYHPKNITINDIHEMYLNGVSLLRCCFDLNNVEHSLQLITKAKEIGLKSCANFTRVSQLPIDKLLHYSVLASEAGADVIYLADSNGSLLPHDVANIVSQLKSSITAEIGFHAHNNLKLAMANSIAAIDSGATFIDSSLRGMGKGSGNLQTESWIAYLLRSRKSQKYNFGKILEAVEYLTENLQASNPEFFLQDIMAGSLDYSIEDKVKLNSITLQKFNELFITKLTTSN